MISFFSVSSQKCQPSPCPPFEGWGVEMVDTSKLLSFSFHYSCWLLACIFSSKYGSKRTNHCVQSSQPMTTRLKGQSTNNITTSLTNHINGQSIYTTHWRYTNHLTLKVTSAQVVKTSVNVTLNSPSQDYTHPDDRTPLIFFLGCCE